MRHRLFAVLAGGLLALAIAGPALADTTPGPGGNYRDSGSSDYFGAWSSECGQNTCTDTNVYGAITDLQGGDTYAYVCIDQFTYPLRGGGRSSSLSGCADVAPSFADDLSSVSVDTTIQAFTCGRRTCSDQLTDVDLSVSLSTVSSPYSYSYTQKNSYENCTDTYRVKGSASDAEGTISVDGSSLDAYGQIGSETFAFTSRCH